MALKWIIGDFIDGRISEENVLPVVKDKEKFTRNIHADEEINVHVSKRDLPDPKKWKEYLEPGQKLVALVDDQKAWNEPGSIVCAGPVIRANGRVRETIEIKGAGMKEWFARRYLTTKFSGKETDPEAKKTRKRQTWEQAINAIMLDAFEGGDPNVKPPAVNGNIFDGITGDKGLDVFNRDMVSYLSAIEELQAMGEGNEYQFDWAWTDETKTYMKFVPVVAPDNAPQLNADQTLSVTLDDTAANLISYQETASIDGFATRLIAHSVAGDAENSIPSDFEIRLATPATPKVVWDATFTPGMELTPEQMNNQLTARLQFMTALQGSAELEVAGAYDMWLGNLGKHLQIDGGTNVDSSGYSITVRIVETGISVSNAKVTIKVMPLAARYPRLIKAHNAFSAGRGASGTNLGGQGGCCGKGPADQINSGPIPRQETASGSTPVVPEKLPEDYGSDLFTEPLGFVSRNIGNPDGIVFAAGLTAGERPKVWRMSIPYVSDQPEPDNHVIKYGQGKVVRIQGPDFYTKVSPWYPDIDITINQIDVGTNTVGDNQHAITIPGSTISARSIAQMAGGRVQMMRNEDGTTQPAWIDINGATVPSIATQKDLYAWAWSSAGKLYVHFLEQVTFKPGPASVQYHSWTISFNMSPTTGVLSNQQNAPTFGKGVLASDVGWHAFPVFKRAIRWTPDVVDFYGVGIAVNADFDKVADGAGGQYQIVRESGLPVSILQDNLWQDSIAANAISSPGSEGDSTTPKGLASTMYGPKAISDISFRADFTRADPYFLTQEIKTIPKDLIGTKVEKFDGEWAFKMTTLSASGKPRISGEYAYYLDDYTIMFTPKIGYTLSARGTEPDWSILSTWYASKSEAPEKRHYLLHDGTFGWFAPREPENNTYYGQLTFVPMTVANTQAYVATGGYAATTSIRRMTMGSQIPANEQVTLGNNAETHTSYKYGNNIAGEVLVQVGDVTLGHYIQPVSGPVPSEERIGFVTFA